MSRIAANEQPANRIIRPGGSLHLLAPLPLPADEVAVLRQKLACIDPAALDSAVAAGTLDVLPRPSK